MVVVVVVVIFNLLFSTVGFYSGWRIAIFSLKAHGIFMFECAVKNKFDLYFYSAFSLGACLK